MNTLARAIANFNSEHPFSEKWLLAPSLRAGYQWLDTVTAGEQASVNVRVKTVRRMALDLVSDRLAQKRLRPLRDREGVFLTGIIFSRLREKGKGSGYQNGKKNMLAGTHDREFVFSKSQIFLHYPIKILELQNGISPPVGADLRVRPFSQRPRYSFPAD